jgi:hypothetical protein
MMILYPKTYTYKYTHCKRHINFNHEFVNILLDIAVILRTFLKLYMINWCVKFPCSDVCWGCIFIAETCRTVHVYGRLVFLLCAYVDVHKWHMRGLQLIIRVCLWYDLKPNSRSASQDTLCITVSLPYSQHPTSVAYTISHCSYPDSLSSIRFL